MHRQWNPGHLATLHTVRHHHLLALRSHHHAVVALIGSHGGTLLLLVLRSCHDLLSQLGIVLHICHGNLQVRMLLVLILLCHLWGKMLRTHLLHAGHHRLTDLGHSGVRHCHLHLTHSRLASGHSVRIPGAHGMTMGESLHRHAARVRKLLGHGHHAQ